MGPPGLRTNSLDASQVKFAARTSETLSSFYQTAHFATTQKTAIFVCHGLSVVFLTADNFRCILLTPAVVVFWIGPLVENISEHRVLLATLCRVVRTKHWPKKFMFTGGCRGKIRIRHCSDFGSLKFRITFEEIIHHFRQGFFVT